VRSDDFIVFVLMLNVLFGGLAGYIAGVFVGSVFLIADVVRQAYIEAMGWKAGRLDDDQDMTTSSPQGDQVDIVELVPIGESSAAGRRTG
jgi:hypothetical protein